MTIFSSIISKGYHRSRKGLGKKILKRIVKVEGFAWRVLGVIPFHHLDELSDSMNVGMFTQYPAVTCLGYLSMEFLV